MRTWSIGWMVVGGIAWLWAAGQGVAAPPAAGLYRIESGTYSECCGFVGAPDVYALPRTSQVYVELTLDEQGTAARMAFLGDDLHTVLKAPQIAPGAGITFLLTNGLVYGDHLQFGGEVSIPENPVWYSYTVSNSAQGLMINGTATAQVGADIPTNFQHTNVVAVPLAPEATPALSSPRLSAGGALQFTVGNGRAGQTNVIEASGDLLNWTPVSTNVFPVMDCPLCPYIDFEEARDTNGTARFYRSHALP